MINYCYGMKPDKAVRLRKIYVVTMKGKNKAEIGDKSE